MQKHDGENLKNASGVKEETLIRSQRPEEQFEAGLFRLTERC